MGGTLYTFAEFSEKYRGEFTENEIWDYWNNDMKPEVDDMQDAGVANIAREANILQEEGEAQNESHADYPTEAARAAREAEILGALPDQNGAERRRDPDDGKLYTLQQLRAKYQKNGFSWYEPGFSRAEID